MLKVRQWPLTKLPSISFGKLRFFLTMVQHQNDEFTSFTLFETCLQKSNEVDRKVPQSRNSSINFLWNSARRATMAGILSSWGNIVHLKCHVPGTYERIMRKLEPSKVKQLISEKQILSIKQVFMESSFLYEGVINKNKMGFGNKMRVYVHAHA